MESSDPATWTVDDVVAHFCSPGPLWANLPSSAPPCGVQLATIFSDNHIDGQTLLREVTMQVLKEDLQIKALGHRAAICNAIERLRLSSIEYESQLANIAQQESRVRARAHAVTPVQTPTLHTPRLMLFPSIELAQPPKVDSDALHTSTDFGPNLRPGEVAHGDGPRKRRRLASTTTDPNTTDLISTDQSSNLYLCRHNLDLDEHFNTDSQQQQLDDTDPDDEFTFINISDGPAGHHSFVKSRVHTLMRTDAIYEKDRAVLYPYPERLVKQNSARSATVFTVIDGEAVATRKNALFLDTDHTTYDNAGQHDTSWDYLGLKYQTKEGEEDVLPLYQDSGSENEYRGSLLDELDQEMADREAAGSVKYLSTDEVGDLIEETYKTYTDRWNDEKQPSRARRAYTLWKKGRGRRGQLTYQTIKHELQTLQTRLDKQRRDIQQLQWRTQKQVRKQCASSEPTVYDIAYRTWQLAVITGSRPGHTTKPRTRSVKTPQPEDSESGDLIESSDSDVSLSYVPDSGPLAMDDEVPDIQDSLDHEIKVENSRSRKSSEDSVLGPLPRTRFMTPFEPTSAENPVDLTTSPSPAKSSPANQAGDIDYGIPPEDAKDQDIRRWSWDSLVETSDRKRIILKLLAEMEPDIQQRVESLVQNSRQEKVSELVRNALLALKAERASITGVDVSSARTGTLFMLGRLWLCWYTGTKSPIIGAIDRDTITSASEMDDFESFWDFMHAIGHLANESSSAEDEDEDPILATKHRKRKLAADRQSQAVRSQAQARRQLGQARESAFKETQSSGLMMDSHLLVVNSTKAEDEDDIYLNPHIASRIKDHQLKGIRFMWRELVMVAQDVKEGCLLAHTMGLGKTMQTIAVLVTIAEAAMSDNPGIAQQIPGTLAVPRHLVLCPAALIDNWVDELKMWMPPHAKTLGPIYAITARVSEEDRVATIKKWYDTRGLLILSYDMFRVLVKPNSSSRKSSAESDVDEMDLDPTERAEIRRKLLTGPSIVVADEAHKIKNKKSAVGGMVHEFTTKSRIALTGSPLANNLQDYYAMIDWIALGYLGNEKEFKARYKEPIEAGVHADSTRNEQRRSLKKLKALKADIEPKIDRADITVLQGELCSKTEFVITVPMTESQRKVYTLIIGQIQGLGEATNATARLWTWIHTLGNLCNHPSIMYRVLENRIKEEKKAAAAASKHANPKSADTSGKSMSQILFEQMRKLGLDGQTDVNLSAKMPIIAKIITECKRLKERVLVFSQQIPMLNYLQMMIPTLPGQISCVRLDGKTDMSLRLDMVKEFNSGSADVFLISTKAGGLGLNISGASRVILCDFGFNPSHEQQAVGRAYRIGQTKEVFVYHLVSGGTYEEKLHHVTIFKQQLSSRVVDDKQPQRAALKAKDYLFEPTEVQQEELSEFKGKDDIMDQLLYSGEGELIRSLKTTETMHQEREEELTAEEEREVQNDIQDDKLRRSDPEAWRRKINATVPGMRNTMMTGPLQAPTAARVTTAPMTPKSTAAPGMRPAVLLDRPIIGTPGSPSLPAPSTLPAFLRPTFGNASVLSSRLSQTSASRAPASLSIGQAWSQPSHALPIDPTTDLPATNASVAPPAGSGDEEEDFSGRAKQVNIAGPRPAAQKPIKDPYAPSGRTIDQRRKQTEKLRLKQLQSFGTPMSSGHNKQDRGRVGSESQTRVSSTQQQGQTKSDAIALDDSDAG